MKSREQQLIDETESLIVRGRKETKTEARLNELLGRYAKANGTAVTCRSCGRVLQYVHGHGACLNAACILYSQNQAPCCEGEQAVASEASASELSAAEYRENIDVQKAESIVLGEDEVTSPSPLFEVAENPRVLVRKKDK